MTLPDASDREAVRLWFVKEFPDHGYRGMGEDGRPEYDLAVLDMGIDAVLALVAREVERERVACAKIAREMARQARAASNEHGEKDVEEAEAAEAIDVAAASMAETIESQIRARGRTA